MPPLLNLIFLNKRILLLVLLAMIGTVVVFRVDMKRTKAQSINRQVEINIPSHLPLKVKLKKEKEQAVKDMRNEKWLRDFQLEVTNTGEKPIYFLHLMVILPTVKDESDRKIMFPLYYGRSEISDVKTKADPRIDRPIAPGDTYVFEITPSQVPAWDEFVKEGKLRQPEKIEITFEILSFGDGTGFAGTDGVALPHPVDLAQRCQNPDIRGNPSVKRSEIDDDLMQPATFLPVNFCLQVHM